MNTKVIMLISTLFCASFGMTMVAGQFQTIHLDVTPRPILLTATEKKIYDDLIARFNSKKLTVADCNDNNVRILNSQRHNLRMSLNYWREIDPLGRVVVPVMGIGGAALFNYSGYLGDSFLKYLIGKEIFASQKETLETINKVFSTGTSIGTALSLAYAGSGLAYDYIVGIHNFLYSRRNKQIENEITLIDDVIRALRFSPSYRVG